MRRNGNAAVQRIWNRQHVCNIPTWTTERVELLKSHFEAGLSCREIAGAHRRQPQRRDRQTLPPQSDARQSPCRAAPASNRQATRRAIGPRLQYHILRAVYDGRTADRRCADRQRAALLAVRTQRAAMPLADQYARRRGFLLLRQHAARRPALLLRAYPPRLQVGLSRRAWRSSYSVFETQPTRQPTSSAKLW